MEENDLKVLKTEMPHKGNRYLKKLAYPHEYFNSLDDYRKPVNNLSSVN